MWAAVNGRVAGAAQRCIAALTRGTWGGEGDADEDSAAEVNSEPDAWQPYWLQSNDIHMVGVGFRTPRRHGGPMIYIVSNSTHITVLDIMTPGTVINSIVTNVIHI